MPETEAITIGLVVLGLLGGLTAWLHANVRGFISRENERQDDLTADRFKQLDKRLDNVETKQDEHEKACTDRNERDAARYARLEAALGKKEE